MFILVMLTQHVSSIIMLIISLHILNNRHEYGPIDKTMKLLKPVNSTTLLHPYELFFMQSLQKADRLISEQNPEEPHPLLQLAINPSHPLS